MPSTNTLTPLAGSARALRPGSKLIGPTNPQELVQVTVRLRSCNKKPVPAGQFAALPPLKRNYLSRKKFAAAYGAAPADVAKIKSFARKYKLAVVSVNPAHRHVVLSGSVKALGEAFGVKLHDYEHSQGNYRGRVGPINLPAELIPAVEGVFGLDNRCMARPHIVWPKKSSTKKKKTSQSASSFTAVQLAQLYNFPAGLDGTGECIGILEFGGGYKASDLATYFKQLGLTAPTVSSVSVDGASNSPGTDDDADGEVALDIEVAGAISPAAKIVVYFAPFTEQGWVDALTTAIHDTVNKPSVLSISWGYAEGESVQGFEWTQQAVQAVNQVLQAGASMGVSVCVASGDSGSSEGIDDGQAHVDFPASSPYVLGCGGTTLTVVQNKITSEVAWSDSGGGISAMNPLPSWQTGLVPPSVNSGHATGRGVPDVCADADPDTGYEIYYDGASSVVGGTSAVATFWAGLLGRLNQKLGTPVGYFNPLLYSTLGKSNGFNDIVQGSNGSYSAGPGWDACTGWGSPNGANLLQGFSTPAA
jgi:kumamolisin